MYDSLTVARILDVHVETVRRLIASGRLKAIDVGGRYRIPADALDAYVASVAVNP